MPWHSEREIGIRMALGARMPTVVALVLVVVAILASAVPAWRATRVDPNAALRAE